LFVFLRRSLRTKTPPMMKLFCISIIFHLNCFTNSYQCSNLLEWQFFPLCQSIFVTFASVMNIGSRQLSQSFRLCTTEIRRTRFPRLLPASLTAIILIQVTVLTVGSERGRTTQS
jgi:hypothetical protein